MLAILVIPASAQQKKHPAPGSIIIPPSSLANAEDLGVRAHTNIRLVAPPAASPSELPPYLGYGYETPASLACIYRLVSPIKGCNPNLTTNTPSGGSQTIAIVDAFHDPNAASDLEHFSAQFGIPFDPAKFQIVYAQGTQPPVDPTGGWELEEALDIEYSHAMAPQAMLYLVEANSNSFSDLFGAVLVAKNLVRCGNTASCPADANGKGEVSMSWGGGEFSVEANYDWVFTGKNVVYLAATGDAAGTIYPSASPNVIAVGGTSTARSLANGNLIQEIAWSDAGSGLSAYEPTPPYQSILGRLTQGARALPDVSADANPNNGYWEYNSFPYAGVDNPSNWWIVGGTSASTPLWAGIINSQSTASGHFAASTQEQLTGMYTMPAVAGGTGASGFWDITYGACNYYSGSFSTNGYDLCTGLGSPKGN
jgi:kumamolisin